MENPLKYRYLEAMASVNPEAKEQYWIETYRERLSEVDGHIPTRQENALEALRGLQESVRTERLTEWAAKALLKQCYPEIEYEEISDND